MFSYLEEKKVYDLVFKVLNYNFRNSKLTHEFISILKEELKTGNNPVLIKDFIKKNNLIFNTENERVDLKIEEITKLSNNFSFNSMLDIGCGNGHVLSELRKNFNIEKDNTFGIDVVDYLDSEDFTYIKYKDNKIPLENNSIDFSTCMMVLHHTENPKHYIKEIKRVLKKDGVLILRETDAYDLYLLHFNMVMEYIFYEILFNIPVNITRNYFSKNEWKSLFLNNGFSILEEKYFSVDENPFTPFYFVLKKN